VPDISEIASDIVRRWLNARQGSRYEIVDSEPNLLLRDGDKQVSISARPIFDVGADRDWPNRLQVAAEELDNLIRFPLAVWIPPETDLPVGGQSEFLQRIADAASALELGQRGQVEFPVKLTLKKTGTEGSYVQVTGGLAPHWARLTGRAYGQYVLDTTAIHRLPEPESRVADLLEWVALIGNGMKPGSSSEIKSEDAWTLYRPDRGSGCVFIGATPHTDPTNGTKVRVLLRDALRKTSTEAGPAGALRALLLVGIYRSINDETATIALRSCDPDMYASFDLVCLIADGACKPLFERRGASF
jgi:hypothetical protein